MRTPSGLVFEFQHSAIKPQERIAREAFYQNMLWIVDGTRLKRDRPRIDKNLADWLLLPEEIVRLSYWPGEFLPKQWLSSSVPVLFDFHGLKQDEEETIYDIIKGQYSEELQDALQLTRLPVRQDQLICLLPNRFRDKACYFAIERDTLVKVRHGNAAIFDWKQLHRGLAERDAAEAEQAAKAEKRMRIYRWSRRYHRS